MEANKIIEVMDVLIGKTEPVGDSAIDEKRLKNLKEACKVLEWLYGEVEYVASRHHDSPYSSCAFAGNVAKIKINEIKQEMI